MVGKHSITKLQPSLQEFLFFLSGEIPKQVKVKKLKNLKTLDSKPGIDFSYLYLLVRQCMCGGQRVVWERYFSLSTVDFRDGSHGVWLAQSPFPAESVCWPVLLLILSIYSPRLLAFSVYLLFLGVYTSYKPYLNRDEEIIKQLQKVNSCSYY
jgi:hypothetical protein